MTTSKRSFVRTAATVALGLGVGGAVAWAHGPTRAAIGRGIARARDGVQRGWAAMREQIVQTIDRFSPPHEPPAEAHEAPHDHGPHGRESRENAQLHARPPHVAANDVARGAVRRWSTHRHA